MRAKEIISITYLGPSFRIEHKYLSINTRDLWAEEMAHPVKALAHKPEFYPRAHIKGEGENWLLKVVF